MRHLHSENTKIWSRKNVHAIFVSASVSSSIEGKSLLRKRDIFLDPKIHGFFLIFSLGLNQLITQFLFFLARLTDYPTIPEN